MQTCGLAIECRRQRCRLAGQRVRDPLESGVFDAQGSRHLEQPLPLTERVARADKRARPAAPLRGGDRPLPRNG